MLNKKGKLWGTFVVLIALAMLLSACGPPVLKAGGGGCEGLYCYGSATGSSREEAIGNAKESLREAMARHNRCGGEGPDIKKDQAVGDKHLIKVYQYNTYKCPEAQQESIPSKSDEKPVRRFVPTPTTSSAIVLSAEEVPVRMQAEVDVYKFREDPWLSLMATTRVTGGNFTLKDVGKSTGGGYDFDSEYYTAHFDESLLAFVPDDPPKGGKLTIEKKRLAVEFFLDGEMYYAEKFEDYLTYARAVKERKGLEVTIYVPGITEMGNKQAPYLGLKRLD